MNKDSLLELLNQFKTGEIAPEEVCERIAAMPYEDLGYARIDHHRSLMQNFPEVVYCPGKTDEQITGIVERLAAHNPNVIATRADLSTYEYLKQHLTAACYDPIARLIYIHRDKRTIPGKVLLVTAGTADLPVAEEAALSLTVMGAEVERVYDVGVAGLHRLTAILPVLNKARVVVVVAGMEGALASVIGGLTSRPVIAVPTSVGYGASFNGLAALLAMLNSCASGVGVVNIDNGYGAAALAYSIMSSRDE